MGVIVNVRIENVIRVKNECTTVHNAIVPATEDVSMIHVRVVVVADAVHRLDTIWMHAEMEAIVDEMLYAVRISVTIVVVANLIQETIIVVIIIAGTATINVHMRGTMMLNVRITATDHGVSVNAKRPDVIHVTVTDARRHNRVVTIHSDVPTIQRSRPAWTSIAIKFVTMSGRIFGMASLGPTEMINIRRNDHFQNENETQIMKTTNGAAEMRIKMMRPTPMRRPRKRKRNRILV